MNGTLDDQATRLSDYDMNRVHVELERLNIATDIINKLEKQLDGHRTAFRESQAYWSQKLDRYLKKFGSSIDKARPYYEARMRLKQYQEDAQKAAVRFERANSLHAVAKQQVTLTQESLARQGAKNAQAACLEVLNHHIQRVNDAERERLQSEDEHRRRSAEYLDVFGDVSRLEKELKKSITKSKPYFLTRVEFIKSLEDQKSAIQRLESEIKQKKRDYAESLKKLEEISDEIHAIRALGARSAGVGAEHPDPPVKDIERGNSSTRNSYLDIERLKTQSRDITEELPSNVLSISNDAAINPDSSYFSKSPADPAVITELAVNDDPENSDSPKELRSGNSPKVSINNPSSPSLNDNKTLHRRHSSTPMLTISKSQISPAPKPKETEDLQSRRKKGMSSGLILLAAHLHNSDSKRSSGGASVGDTISELGASLKPAVLCAGNTEKYDGIRENAYSKAPQLSEIDCGRERSESTASMPGGRVDCHYRTLPEHVRFTPTPPVSPESDAEMGFLRIDKSNYHQSLHTRSSIDSSIVESQSPSHSSSIHRASVTSSLSVQSQESASPSVFEDNPSPIANPVGAVSECTPVADCRSFVSGDNKLERATDCSYENDSIKVPILTKSLTIDCGIEPLKGSSEMYMMKRESQTGEHALHPRVSVASSNFSYSSEATTDEESNMGGSNRHHSVCTPTVRGNATRLHLSGNPALGTGFTACDDDVRAFLARPESILMDLNLISCSSGEASPNPAEGVVIDQAKHLVTPEDIVKRLGLDPKVALSPKLDRKNKSGGLVM